MIETIAQASHSVLAGQIVIELVIGLRRQGTMIGDESEGAPLENLAGGLRADSLLVRAAIASRKPTMTAPVTVVSLSAAQSPGETLGFRVANTERHAWLHTYGTHMQYDQGKVGPAPTADRARWTGRARETGT